EWANSSCRWARMVCRRPQSVPSCATIRSSSLTTTQWSNPAIMSFCSSPKRSKSSGSSACFRRHRPFCRPPVRQTGRDNSSTRGQCSVVGMKHQFATVQRILGALLMLFSISMLIPLALAVFYGEGGAAAFALAFAISSGAGLVAWLPVRHTTNDLKIRDGSLVVVLFYIVLGGFGSLPLMIADVPGMSPTDALFEAISGITSTGATVLTAIDTLPHAILFWRQLLLWIGGMGIIVLAVAVMPML